MLNSVIFFALLLALPLVSVGSVNERKPDDSNSSLMASRESSLHPEHDPHSSSYSGRSAPGPYHGDNPHGDDPHDENHPALPANQEKLPAKEEQDKYYKGGLHVPELAPDFDSKKGDGKTDPKPGEDEPGDNDLKKQAPIGSDKKRVGDLSPLQPKPL